MLHNEKPFYFVPADEPFISQYESVLQKFGASDEKTFEITLHTDLVYRCEVSSLQQMILALQHHPASIEKMLFSLDIKFTLIEGSELFIPASYWKKDAVYYRWFHHLAASPLMLFFLNDADARFYTLAGDMIALNLVPVESGAWKNMQTTGLDEDQVAEITTRLFTACWMMLVYCHGSSFSPEQSIKGLLEEFQVPINYQDVYEKYRLHIEENNDFRMRNVA